MTTQEDPGGHKHSPILDICCPRALQGYQRLWNSDSLSPQSDLICCCFGIFHVQNAPKERNHRAALCAVSGRCVRLCKTHPELCRTAANLQPRVSGLEALPLAPLERREGEEEMEPLPEVTRSLWCCRNPGPPAFGFCWSPAGWETGNTAVHPA